MHPNPVVRSLARVGIGALLLIVGCTSTVTPPAAPPVPGQPPPLAASVSAAAPLPPEDLRATVKRQEDENALLREKLAQRDEQIGVLQKEIGRLQARTQKMQATLAQLRAAAGATEVEPAAGKTKDANALAAAQAELDATRQQLATAQNQLENERQHRAGVETELRQLKQETSTAPLAPQPGAVAAPDELAEARREIDDLRKRLDTEHAQQEKTAAQLAALEANRLVPSAVASPADAEEQKRLADLQARQQEIVASANRELEASRKHEAELQDQLAAAQREIATLRTRADQVAVPVERMKEAQAQNEQLRQGIGDVERRNQELTAKLKVATRVADLIFKMKAGRESLASGQGQVADGRGAELRQRVEAWRAAWSSGDIDAYSAFYAPGFIDDQGRTRAAWAERKRAIFERSGKIDVGIRQLAVKVDGDTAETDFDQSYASALEHSRCRKRLTWRQQGGTWLIVAETVTKG